MERTCRRILAKNTTGAFNYNVSTLLLTRSHKNASWGALSLFVLLHIIQLWSNSYTNIHTFDWAPILLKLIGQLCFGEQQSNLLQSHESVDSTLPLLLLLMLLFFAINVSPPFEIKPWQAKRHCCEWVSEWVDGKGIFTIILITFWCAHLARVREREKDWEKNKNLFFPHSLARISHKCLNMSFISAERFIVWNVAGGSFSSPYEKILGK